METLPSRGRLESSTEYRQQYIPNQVKVDEPVVPLEYKPNKAKFDGTTTYNRYYEPKPIEHHSDFKPERYQPKNTHFEGKTTYNTEYKPHRIEAEPVKKVEYRAPDRGRLMGESRYREVIIVIVRNIKVTGYNRTKNVKWRNCLLDLTDALLARHTSTIAQKKENGSEND